MGYIMELRKVLGTRPIILTGSCVIVRNEHGDFLLQKRTDTNDWGTIGGAMEPGESLEETASRELMEEAGLVAGSFRFVALLSGRDMYFRYPHGDEVYNVMAVYEAQNVTGTPSVNDDEGLELRYFPVQGDWSEVNPFTIHVLRKAGYLQEQAYGRK
jgi:NTP pyrophosphohydrolases containing a Zn-finger, probably nucleic-acid-binding